MTLLPPSLPLPVARYLKSRKIAGPWSLEGCMRNDFRGVIVVPAFDEEESLPATLKSLSENPSELLGQTMVLVVVNHREDSEEGHKASNRRTLERFRSHPDAAKLLNLAWVDAASPGKELPGKSGGVGLARKIGFDLALEHLDHGHQSPLLISLDADTLVRSDYLSALFDHFSKTDEGGAVLNFRHRPAENSAQTAAIERYELFLRSYVLGLSLARSPYAFHTIGSAFACRADAYIRSGGMNRRTGGEDFYFLQQLSKTSGIARIRGTTVFPSPRTSHRVPFGTGPSVARLMTGDENAVLFYPPEAFTLLGMWLSLAAENWHSKAADLLKKAEKISPYLSNHLTKLDISVVWDRLSRNNSSKAPFTRAFHEWFDALKTLRLIHDLCDNAFFRLPPEIAVPPLLEQAGVEISADVGKQLAILRDYQGEGCLDTAEPPESPRTVF